MFFITFCLRKQYHIMDLERGVIIENMYTKLLVSFNAVFNPYVV